jgi:signal transduction histidine kinase
MIRAARPTLVWGLAVITTGAATAAALVAQRAGLDQVEGRWVDAVTVSATVVVGALILTARPGHRVGQIMLIGGSLWGLSAPAIEWAVASALHNPEPAVVAVATVALAVRGLGYLLLVSTLAIVFPDGHLPGPRWRWVRWLVAMALGLFLMAALLQRYPIDIRIEHLVNPLAPAAAATLAEISFLVSFALTIAAAGTGFVALWRRWRQATPLLREQIGWVLLACLAVPVVLLLGLLDVSEELPYPLAVSVLPIAIGFAVLQRRLYHLDQIVNRSVLYAALTASVLGIYVLAVAGIGSMIGVRGGWWLGLIGAGAVALAAEPVRRALQQGVNRLVYGDWEDPTHLGERLGVRLADAAAPDAAMSAALTELTTALRLHWAAIDTAEGRTAVAGRAQEAADDPTEIPLVHEGASVGALLVVANRSLRARDVALLNTLARQIAPIVRARHLALELRRSRDQLVLAQQDERRRLRRDLHDGLGPTLAALAFKVDTARNVLSGDQEAHELLVEIRDRLRDTVTDVRRVVENLRPPDLDEVGLGGALSRLMAGLPGPTRFQLRLPDDTGGLSSATGVAAYRIVQEALTNVVRHAGATTCEVEVATAGGALRLVVTDDGHGLIDGTRTGNGLSTMRERAEELGGALLVSAEPGRGTVVAATLPRGMS